MRKTYVYFIQQGSKRSAPIKIGVAVDVEKRMCDLQTANPYKLRILLKIPCKSQKEAYDREYYLHKKFKKYRLEGEWFRGYVMNKLKDLNDHHATDYVDTENLHHWLSIVNG